MRFEYTMSLEDLREASESKSPTKKSVKPSQSLLSWLPLFLVCVVFALPGRLMMGSTPYGLLSPVPVQNLWVTIAPSLCLTTFLTTASVTQAWNAYRLQRAKAAGKSIKTNPIVGNVLAYASFLWVIPALYPSLSIDWTPTAGQILFAAFAPWSLWFAFIGFSAARRKLRAVDNAREKRPSMRRTSQVEVTPDGVAVDDGVISHRFKWIHYKRYGETRNLLLLINENDLTTFIAKRAVPQGPDMDELRMLISENIKEGSFLTSANAFPVILPVIEISDGE